MNDCHAFGHAYENGQCVGCGVPSGPTAEPGPTLNVDELEAIYRLIELHPESWRQQNYVQRTACGTAFCFAGHALHRAGWHVADAVQHGVTWFQEGALLLYGPDDSPADWCEGDELQRQAAHLLGLTQAESDELFAPNNELDEIRTLLDQIERDGADQGRVIA
jgi:hypothetical protein